MKFSKKYYFLILLLIIIIAVFGLTSYLKSRLPEKKTTEQQQISQPIIDNTLKETPADLMQFTFDFQIGQSTSTVSVSWDELKIKIFYLILLDKKAAEQGEGEPLVWGISALKKIPPDLSEIEKLKTFLVPPYIIGTKAEGFTASKEDGITLGKGKEYWLQLVGLDNDKKVKFTSKTFVF